MFSPYDQEESVSTPVISTSHRVGGSIQYSEARKRN